MVFLFWVLMGVFLISYYASAVLLILVLVALSFQVVYAVLSRREPNS